MLVCLALYIYIYLLNIYYQNISMGMQVIKRQGFALKQFKRFTQQELKRSNHSCVLQAFCPSIIKIPKRLQQL